MCACFYAILPIIPYPPKPNWMADIDPCETTHIHQMVTNSISQRLCLRICPVFVPFPQDIIRRRIDNAPKLQRVTFQMKKGTRVRAGPRQVRVLFVLNALNFKMRHLPLFWGGFPKSTAQERVPFFSTGGPSILRIHWNG